MDAGITAAARALDAGDCLTALKLVGARPDAPALALRGVALARLGELGDARALLRRAARGFADDPRARARCTVASAEIELADRDLARPTDLTEAVRALSAAGDARNVAWARLVLARRAILLGRLDEAEARLAAVPGEGGDLPPVIAAVRALADLEIALRRLDAPRARAAVERAEALGRTTRLPALEAEIAAARGTLDGVVALARTKEGALEIRLEDLDALAGEGALVVDACRRRVVRGSQVRDLRRRPAMLALLRALAAAHPESVPRDVLATTLWGTRRPNASHRSRLRVEIGRARSLVRGLAGVVATTDGYRLDTAARVVVLDPPEDTEGADVLALVESGGAWTAASLATALACGVRRVQRALKVLDEAGRVRGIGRGPARRWSAAPRIASRLLLPGLLLVR